MNEIYKRIIKDNRDFITLIMYKNIPFEVVRIDDKNIDKGYIVVRSNLPKGQKKDGTIEFDQKDVYMPVNDDISLIATDVKVVV